MRNHIFLLPLFLFILMPYAADARSGNHHFRKQINLHKEAGDQLNKQDAHDIPFIDNADFEPLKSHYQWLYPDTVTARPEDVSSIDGIIGAMYDVISGPAGPRNWERMASLFKPGAKLATFGKNEQGKPVYVAMTQKDYRRHNEPFFMKNDFWEEEIGREVFRFGEIATVQSAYRFRLSDHSGDSHRGVNSIQLVYDQGRWWITNITWNSEREDNPIPKDLLNNKDTTSLN